MDRQADWGARFAPHRRVGVADEVPEDLQEALVLDELGVDVVQLCHAHRSGLAHVRVLRTNADSAEKHTRKSTRR